MKQRRIRKLVKKFINAIDNEGAQDVANRVKTINAMNAAQLKAALLNVDQDIIGGTAVPNKADAFPNDARETEATADGTGKNKAIHDAALAVADKRAEVGTANAGLFKDITDQAKAGGTVATALAAVPQAPADNGPDNGFADYETKYIAAETALTTLENLVGNYETFRDEALAVWNTIKDFTPTAGVKYGNPGVLVLSCGLVVFPGSKYANSVVIVLPIIIAPDIFKRLTTSASALSDMPFLKTVPHSVGISCVPIISLRPIGKP